MGLLSANSRPLPSHESSKKALLTQSTSPRPPLAGQCRPLSKTIRFQVLKVTKNKRAEKAAKQFGKF